MIRRSPRNIVIEVDLFDTDSQCSKLWQSTSSINQTVCKISLNTISRALATNDFDEKMMKMMTKMAALGLISRYFSTDGMMVMFILLFSMAIVLILLIPRFLL